MKSTHRLRIAAQAYANVTSARAFLVAAAEDLRRGGFEAELARAEALTKVLEGELRDRVGELLE